ncbi:UNVERIFIED_CONTAM: hypothetical protein FKN15_000436 [Acipenser sinensis]
MRCSALFVQCSSRGFYAGGLIKFNGRNTASTAEPSVALGAPPCPSLSLLNLFLSSSQSIPCAQSPTWSAKQAKHSRQAQDITDLKNQMAKVLEYLARQQAQASAPAQMITPAQELTPPAPMVTPDVPELDVNMADEDQDTILIVASWESGSLHQEEEELTFKMSTSSEITSDAGFSPIPNSIP